MITGGGDPRTGEPPPIRHHGTHAVPLACVKTSRAGHVDLSAAQRWPQLAEVAIRWRGGSGDVTGYLPED